MAVMVIGSGAETGLKRRSEELGIPFSDLLRGYVLEDLMLRIYGSDYREILWLETVSILGEKAYREREQKRISFFYQESERPIPQERLKPGQKLSMAMAEHLQTDIFGGENPQKICWEGHVTQAGNAFLISLVGNYCQMQVPITIFLHGGREARQIPGRRSLELTVLKGKKLSYLVYAPENQLSRDIFTIMEKLELINDMGCYWRAYEILKTQSLSGRFVLDELVILAAKTPQVKMEKRFMQLSSYKNYAYMRKRWEKYLRNHGQQPVPWEDALERILAFVGPVWERFCRDEIFFDDWMPDLGRFLG